MPVNDSVPERARELLMEVLVGGGLVKDPNASPWRDMTITELVEVASSSGVKESEMFDVEAAVQLARRWAEAQDSGAAEGVSPPKAERIAVMPKLSSKAPHGLAALERLPPPTRDGQTVFAIIHERKNQGSSYDPEYDLLLMNSSIGRKWKTRRRLSEFWKLANAHQVASPVQLRVLVLSRQPVRW